MGVGLGVLPLLLPHRQGLAAHTGPQQPVVGDVGQLQLSIEERAVGAGKQQDHGGVPIRSEVATGAAAEQPRAADGETLLGPGDESRYGAQGRRIGECVSTGTISWGHAATHPSR